MKKQTKSTQNDYIAARNWFRIAQAQARQHNLEEAMINLCLGLERLTGALLNKPLEPESQPVERDNM